MAQQHLNQRQIELEQAVLRAAGSVRSVDPLASQSEAEIESHLRALQPGDEVAICSDVAGFLKFEIVEVDGVNAGAGRFYTKQHSYAWGGAAWYMKSGRNCHAPGGKARACIPTAEVRAFANLYPQGRHAFDDALEAGRSEA